MLAVITAVYSVTSWITPGWINAFWLFQNGPPIIILNVPVDDFIFYLLFGAAVGPLYEFLYHARLLEAHDQRIP